ncbi:N-formylglutamate amidohydrolase [Microvirga arsenatis]|uniref:N-formylglutamate amidohydrolase n=1 Tax=Microvirga arsenatis TaxID=2692265 RepID=A0ABW9Z000_9HYPH|nr:N-formylglutamate amidohydrolase [Microvirga arsenatis]NBJ12178.1 N-formylglutamate amidohydrolase [Microvirga arsenatis]NBJ25830.1 N-formylglutamate amidohydrolase [Microvirga arsenatis]
MRPAIVDEFDPPFTVTEPAVQTIPFVFNVPHAGAIYPASFLASSRLDAVALRRSEDAFVDELFAAVTELGAPLMTAHFPRAYLDLNREPYELDSRMFDGRLPSFANTRSMRVAGGLGTIPRIVADGQEIYRSRLPVDEALHRIEWLYKPYHRTLRNLVRRTAQLFGHAVLIDCHSMPASSVSREDGMKADIVLGDRYGTSCATLLIDLVEAALRGRGYAVVRNKPYAGGFITEHYGEPALGRHALQIEINRALYMDERTMQRKQGFDRLASDLTQAFSQVIGDIEGALVTRPIAAE